MWDMFNVMGGLGSIKTWQNNNFAKRDKIHLTKEGYILIGDLMLSAIIKEYDKHLKMWKGEWDKGQGKVNIEVKGKL